MSSYALWRGQGEEAPAGEQQRIFHPREKYFSDIDLPTSTTGTNASGHQCREITRCQSWRIEETQGSVVVPLCLLSTRRTMVLCGWTLQTSNMVWCRVSSSCSNLQSSLGIFSNTQCSRHNRIIRQTLRLLQPWSSPYQGKKEARFLLHLHPHEQDVALLQPFPTVGGVQWRTTDTRRTTSSLKSFLIAHWSQNKLEYTLSHPSTVSS